MNKIALAALAAAVLISAVPVGVGLAQGSIDLGVESVGLLPSNPFYFLKEWGRGFRSLFAKNIGKAELELITLNEKAAELKKLEEITAGRIDALLTAAETYKETAERLRARLLQIKETSIDAAVDRLLSDLVNRTLRHLYLFEQLQSKFAGEERVRTALDELQNSLADVWAATPARLDPTGKFHPRVSASVNLLNDQLRELRAAWFLDRVEEKLTGQARVEAAALREDLLVRFSGRLEGLDAIGVNVVYILENFPGDQLKMLRILDEIRENVQSHDLKNKLNFLRRSILDAFGNRLSEAAARQAIGAAAVLLAGAESEVAESGIILKKTVKELIERGRFNLNQAESFFSEEDYSAAFGQASAAQAILRSAWLLVVQTPDNQSQLAALLRQEYDGLIEKVRAAGLAKDGDPDLFKLLGEAEKMLVELTKLVEIGASREFIAELLRQIRIMLPRIEVMI